MLPCHVTMNQGCCYNALTPSQKYVNCNVNAQPNNNNIYLATNGFVINGRRMRVGLTFVLILMVWYTSLYIVKILSNSGLVSINGGTIYLNLILEEMIFLTNVGTVFGYPGEEEIIQILNYCVLLAKYFIYTNKLNGNNTLDLYSYLVLLMRKIYIEKIICTQQNKPQLFEKWLFLYEGL